MLPTRAGLRSVSFADIGLVAKPRLGGSNTAYHVPEGILLLLGNEISPSGDRRVVDVLDVAPSILTYLGVEVPEAMCGKHNQQILAPVGVNS
jgi:predicted AlkP superfamily phosphohydrolase/phosphomutase